MNATIRTVLGLGLVALIASPAAAQGRGGGMFGRGNAAILLSNASVQKELKLDDDQKKKAEELAEKTREKMQENREATQGLEGEERRNKMMELNRELGASTHKAIAEFLKKDQAHRLHQIALQQQGAMALANDPNVVKKLNLTDSQKEEIQSIQQEMMQEMRTIFQESQGDREAAMKKMGELRQQTLSKVEGKLNDEQRKAWKEMLGAPFEVKWEEN